MTTSTKLFLSLFLINGIFPTNKEMEISNSTFATARKESMVLLHKLYKESLNNKNSNKNREVDIKTEISLKNRENEIKLKESLEQILLLEMEVDLANKKIKELEIKVQEEKDRADRNLAYIVEEQARTKAKTNNPSISSVAKELGF